MATATLAFPKTITENEIKMPTSIIPQKMNLRIRVLHVADYPEIAQKFYEGQKKVLEEFEVGGVSSIKNEWWKNQYSYMIIIEDVDTGEIGAGMRLDVVDNRHHIPLEGAFSHTDQSIIARVHMYDHMLAESCGLWVSKKFSERNLARILTRCAIAIAPKLRIQVILGFVNQYTLKMATEMGFTPVSNVLNNGQIAYPDERYQTTLIEVYVDSLMSAKEEEKALMCWLRTHPCEKIKNEEFRGRITNFEYDLRIM
ncbi:hypothetical protein WAF17_14065 [Bernardetia sp. ABR2-2B]|uniref:hypothetical protein n=1 Tax=Bernardetia sp. ABR2-2B TaxID=3127472 RepID=UPI0030CDAB8C